MRIERPDFEKALSMTAALLSMLFILTIVLK